MQKICGLLSCVLLTASCTGSDLRMSGLDQPQHYVAARVSSYDTTGRNHDCVKVEPKSSYTVAELEGAGRIVHMWFTMATQEADYLQTTKIKIYWDGSEKPAVDVPFGEFHALGHGLIRPVNTPLISVVARPELNHNLRNKNVGGFNSYFPMPYSVGAKIVIENTSDEPIKALYYQIDYQKWESCPSDLRFHACYRETPPGPRENPPGYPVNKEGKYNHLILDTEGEGHLVGVVLNVDALGKGWWEGDDMIWIDGEETPSIHGTGTEDCFGGAWGFRQEHNTPYHGLSVLERVPGRVKFQAGKFTAYRFYERDPIPFTKSIKMSIERGHANDRPDCSYSSVAYWYQR